MRSLASKPGPTSAAVKRVSSGRGSPIWLLENARRQGVSEQVLLAAYPTLRAEDLVNAWNYARSHATEMERQIRESADGGAGALLFQREQS